MEICNLLVNRVILNFHETLAEKERAVLQIMCMFSAVLINPVTHILVPKLVIQVIAHVTILLASLVGIVLRVDNHIP